MPEVRPFVGLLYDPATAGPLAMLVAPPYDVISPAEQDWFYRASPYNVIRLILGRRESGNDGPESQYTRAASFLRTWRARGILRATPEPSVYPYEWTFRVEGRRRRLRGVVAEVALEEWGGSIVPRVRPARADPRPPGGPGASLHPRCRRGRGSRTARRSRGGVPAPGHPGRPGVASGPERPAAAAEVNVLLAQAGDGDGPEAHGVAAWPFPRPAQPADASSRADLTLVFGSMCFQSVVFSVSSFFTSVATTSVMDRPPPPSRKKRRTR